MEGTTELTVVGGDKRPSGRKDSQGIPKAKKPKVVKEKGAELVALFMKAKSAQDKYKDALTKVAEESGFNAAELGKLVRASASDHFAEDANKVEQLGILFEDVGEISVK